MKIWFQTFLELVGAALIVSAITFAAVGFAPERPRAVCVDCN